MNAAGGPARPVWGVAGKYCAGKNAVVEILKARGFAEIDVDRIGHRVLEERRPLIVERFGEAVLSRDGRVDRRALGERVFRDRAGRRELERIVHPAMVEEVRRLLEATPGPVAINAAILLPMGLDRFCDLVICVTAPAWVRLARCLARDRLPLWQALARITAQRGICLKPPGRPVDIYYIRNVRDRRALESRLLRFMQRMGVGRRADGKIDGKTGGKE